MKFRLATLALFAATSTAQADCKSDIQDILKSLETAGPYRMEMTMDAEGQKTNMTGAVIMPHSMMMKMDGMEMVMTPNGVWMAQGGGALQKMPDEMKENMQGMIKQGMNLGVQAVDKAECSGSTEFEGETYNLYKYTAKANFMGVDSKSSVSMYVNDNDQPEWLIIDGEAMGIKSTTKQHITFDDSITIADPK